MSSEPEVFTLPARRGRAIRLGTGEAIKIINTHGSQVVDTWVFSAEDLTEFLSNEHMRPTLGKLWPGKGDVLITNRRRPIMVMEEDTSPGRHDTLMAACDNYRYGLLGCTEYHDNCTDNLHAAMRQIGLEAPECPSPLNLWMNIPVGADGVTGWGEPLSKPGDHVILRARMDCVVAMSACPQDILPINGAACQPTEAHYMILDRRS
ncbi:urea carboxylase-associated family protein [Rhodobacteraceae bacterium 2376]|uniref:Urea carboxylase-associated family protein n=1 Tax=Rhabdonatronobacter sediminivivens TaxID=2743469 RepID=A0A7Z0I173_9RHOB|nr:urea carboxylase-associated family protein [Rhabdonatronobacter sediminivivens]NYS26055.1 urea carboxylase-associated family protein [Rhabdonatronobacter sediminivivens]